MKDVISRGEALKKLKTADIIREIGIHILFLLFSFLFSDFSRSELNRIHIADSFRGIIAQLGEFFNTN